MQEFTRLAVGIALLGLAIFVSLNLGGDSNHPADSQDSTAEVTEPAAPESESLETNWQANPNPSPSIASQSRDSFDDSDIARPEFAETPFARPIPNSPGENMNQVIQEPPTISDQYSPSQPLTVSGRLQRESTLVPVQPKPSFRGTLTRAFEVHVIRHGDTLQSLASEYYGSPNRYLDIYRANKDILSSPLNMPVGVEIRIPSE